jgi:hypothetical protein
MTKGMRHGLRAFAVWAMLAPFLLLSLLPSAAMPAIAPDGSLTMVLCTPDGPVEMVMDLATGQPIEKQHPEGKSDRCDWASSLVTDDLSPALPTLPARSLTATPLAPPPPPAVLADAAATGLPPSTGPPLSA